jgi:hypothetical protein
MKIWLDRGGRAGTPPGHERRTGQAKTGFHGQPGAALVRQQTDPAQANAELEPQYQNPRSCRESFLMPWQWSNLAWDVYGAVPVAGGGAATAGAQCASVVQTVSPMQ